MNPPSMEIVFLILSGAILMAGILYWFWSHLQLTQKKVQLLENAVFELRGMLTQRPEPPVSGSDDRVSSGSDGSSSSGEVAATYTDLSDDDWVAEEESQNRETGATIEHMSTPLAALHAVEEQRTVSVVREGADDLAPGGRMMPAAVAEEKTVDLHALVREEEQFRELFIGGTSVADTPEKKMSSSNSVSSNTEALESMPVKELRRLAEQRGISGAADMRKKEILSALRNQVGSSSGTSGTTVEVERTMDLAEITEIASTFE
jgi:hypothetical protein